MLPKTETITLSKQAFADVPFFQEYRDKTSIQQRVYQQAKARDADAPPLKRKISSIRGMRRYLIREEGVAYIPKSRSLVIPQKELADNPVYERYLRRSTFLDRFEFDHVGRKTWHEELEKTIDPSLISAVCINDNQMTGNSIAGVLLYTSVLARRYGKSDAHLGSLLESQQAKLQELYSGTSVSSEESGRRYNSLPFTDKLTIVHQFCDTIADTLWIIARRTNPQPVAQTIRVTGDPRRSAVVTLAEMAIN